MKKKIMKTTNMENEKLLKKLNAGIEEIHKVILTAGEKKRVLENILNSPLASPYSPVQSLWKRVAYYVISASLVVIVGSGSLVSLAKGSLPGSMLYSLKVDVVEPINSLFTFSLEEKAEYESSLATTRLVEAEILADRGELDTVKEKKLTTLLESHTSALEKTLDKISEQPVKNKNREKIVTNFQSGMNTHAETLDMIHARKKNKLSRESKQKVGGDENKIERKRQERKQENEENYEISKKARASGGKIRDSFRENEKDE